MTQHRIAAGGDAELIRELNRVKVLFQARAVAAAMGLPAPVDATPPVAAGRPS